MLPLGVRYHPKHDAIRKEWLRGRELQFQASAAPAPSGSTEPFPGDVKPVHEGWYAKYFSGINWLAPVWVPQYWDGEHWCYGGGWPEIGGIAAIQDRPWRGLTK